MAKKTNKTSHILDLLTNGPTPETGSPAGSESSRNNTQSQTAASKKVTVVDEGSRNDRLSQEILNKLSEELENETRQENIGQSVSPDAETEETFIQEQNTLQANTEQEEEMDIELESLLEEDIEEEEYHFVNVMEELLEQQDLASILKQYNVCTCARCNADVRALTLTALPAKYVVVGSHSFSPVLNYYENKFKIDMITALNKACSMVRQRPHHKR